MRQSDWLRLLLAMVVSLLIHLGLEPLHETAITRLRHGQTPAAEVMRPSLEVQLPQHESQFAGLSPARPDRVPTAQQSAPPASIYRPELGGIGDGYPPLPAEEMPTTDLSVPSTGSAETYYGRDMLSRRALVKRDINLDRPALAKLAGQGALVLVLFINEAGQVDRIEIESSEVPDALTREVAEEFREVLFHPAQIDGNPVKSRMRIEVSIKPL